MEKKDIRVLALDLDGTLTNDQKVVTPATRAALDAAAAKGVTIVLASGRPTAGIMPLAKELGLDKKGGCILSYNGGAIIDCATGETLYRKQLDAKYVPQLCSFAREQGVVIITYNKQGVVTESPEDEWALKECFTCKLPMQKVEDLAAYVDYPICKMLITLDPARRDEVLEAGRGVFQKYRMSRRDGLHWAFARCVQMPDDASLVRWKKQKAQYLERQRLKAERQAAEAEAARHIF